MERIWRVSVLQDTYQKDWRSLVQIQMGVAHPTWQVWKVMQHLPNIWRNKSVGLLCSFTNKQESVPQKNELTKTKINVAMIGSDTFCSTTSSEQHQVEEILCVPIWLERVLVDKKHISAKTTHMNDFWETGGGVWRMASQILAASESNL
mmetsp:Transcript_7123/g.9643  ORF Transcript_7123/g.9643 Transcript_7123/m.9643 type:complete len:149 (+) Transcript_7123:368-814(+)